VNDFDKVIACFKELEMNNIDINQFNNRILVQKVIFLLQLEGIKFDKYYFDLYIRGPYSPALTRDFFNRPKHLFELKTNEDLTVNEKAILRKLKKIKDLDISTLEIGATYAYLVKIDKLQHDEAIKQIKDLKPFYLHHRITNNILVIKQLLSL